MVAVTSLCLSCFILRRRFPWNIILLSIFVSGLGLSRGPGGAPMAPQLPRWAGKDRRTCGQAGSPLSSPFSPADASHGADDRHDCQVRPGDPAVIGSGVPPVLHNAASSRRGCQEPGDAPVPWAQGLQGSCPGLGLWGRVTNSLQEGGC